MLQYADLYVDKTHKEVEEMPSLDILFGAGKQEKLLFQHFAQMGSLIKDAGSTFRKLTEDLSNARVYANQLHEIEHRGDTVAERIAEVLEHSSFLPLDHDDIEDLRKLGDDTIDAAWHASNFVGRVYKFTDPSEADPELREIGAIIADLYEETGNLFENLKTLKRVKNLIQIVKRFHDKENLTDALRDAVSERRFAAARADSSQSALWAAWEKVYDELEMASDVCVDITDILKTFQRKYWSW